MKYELTTPHRTETPRHLFSTIKKPLHDTNSTNFWTQIRCCEFRKYVSIINEGRRKQTAISQRTAKFRKENTAKLQRFGTQRRRRETKAREPAPLAEEVCGSADNMAEILPRRFRYNEVGRGRVAPREVNYLPADKATRPANYVLMADWN